MSDFFKEEKKKDGQVKGGDLAAMGGYTTKEQGQGQFLNELKWF